MTADSESSGDRDGMEFSTDSRRDDRINYDFPVFFYFATGKRKPREVTYHKGYTMDVSRNGLKLYVENPAVETSSRLSKEGTPLELEVYLPAVFRSKPITTRGEVRWNDRPATRKLDVIVGIELHGLADDQREILKRVAETLRTVTDNILGGEEPT